MAHELFLTKLRTFLNRALCRISAFVACIPVFAGLLTFSFFCFGCGGSSRVPVVSPQPSARVQEKSLDQRVEPVTEIAPWEVWSQETFGDTDFRQAEALQKNGDFLGAARAYEQAQQSAMAQPLRDEAFLRRVGVLLKAGQAIAVLRLVSQQVARRGQKIEEVEGRLALVTAFAYELRGDLDQTLAWLGVAYRQGEGLGQVHAVASHEIERILSRLRSQQFEVEAERWSGDPLLGAFFAKEREQRTSNKRLAAHLDGQWVEYKWFAGPGSSAGQWPMGNSGAGSDISFDDQMLTIGVLAPLSGEFAQYGTRMKHGIELAADELGSNVRFVFGDTAGNPEVAVAEYERLVRQERCRVILGPLLVKTAESVAMKAHELGVPFVTFTKKQGIPELGEEVFRLGATADDQGFEVAKYAREFLGIKTFVSILPDDSQGRDLARAFKLAVQAQGGQILQEMIFTPSNPETLGRLISDLEQLKPQGVFVADTLENARPIFELLKTSPLAGVALLGPASWDDQVAVLSLKNFIEGAIYATPYFAASNRPNVQIFSRKYLEKFGVEADLLSAQAYDAVQIVVKTVNPSLKTSAEVIKKLSVADSLIGVTGKLTMGLSGEIRRRMNVVRIVNGEALEVMAAGEETSLVFHEQNGKEKEEEREKEIARKQESDQNQEVEQRQEQRQEQEQPRQEEPSAAEKE